MFIPVDTDISIYVVKMYLKNSGHLPLRITLELADTSDYYKRRFMVPISPHVPRTLQTHGII